MTNLRFAGRALALAASLPLAAGAQGIASQGADSLERAVDRIFAPFTAAGSPGCLVGVDRDGRPPLMKGYGLANLEYGVPLTRESISESGSVAKQFTAAAVALLHLEGKLSLDEDVRKHLPELHDFGAPITLRNLLTHTSGLRDQWALLGLMNREPGSEVHTMAEILDLASRQRDLNFATGSEYLYSNTGYVLAALVVQRVSGVPFARFTEERLFKPLGMAHTQWRDDYRRIVAGRATAYDREPIGWVQDMPFTRVHGNGGLLSSLEDLLRWNRALTEGLLGKPELTRLLESQMKLSDGRTIDYALGLSVREWRPGVREVSHGGSTAGYRTWLARYPEAKASIAVWCNTATSNPTALANRVMDVVLPRPARARTTPTVVAAEERARIVGTYRDLRTDDLLTIAAVGDYLRLVGGPADTLRAEGGGRYMTPNGTTITLVREGSGAAGSNSLGVRVVGSDGAARFLQLQRAPAPPASVDEYAGTYRSPELGHDVIVRVAQGRITARISPDETGVLQPAYEDGFRFGQSPITLRFVRGADGRITGFRAFAGRARNVRFDRIAAN